MEAIISRIKIKTFSISVAFVALAVFVPAAIHLFGGIEIGRTFLPIYFFVLLAALALGWRAALGVAVFAPIFSHLIFGMPAMVMMPVVIVEMVLYAIISSCRTCFGISKLNEIKILKQVQDDGLIKLIFVVFFIVVTVKIILAVLLFLPIHLAAPVYVLDSIIIGWRGILLQLVLAPWLAKYISKFIADEKSQ